MKKRTLYKWMLPLLAGLLVSCNSILGEEAAFEAQEKTSINFTLSMKKTDAATRSLSPSAITDYITDYENRIITDDFRVLAYTTTNAVSEVSIYSMIQISENVYEILGELKDAQAINRVVVLANCGSGYNLNNPLTDLLYSYTDSNFNPAAPKTYIPMWGEKAITETLKPGTSTDLGTIHLMRAMAKISVKSVGVGGEELTKVILTKVASNGTCVPDTGNVVGTGTDLSVNAPTIPNSITKDETVTFYQLNNKEAFAYLPEQSNGDKLQMTVTLGGKNYTLDFKDYGRNQFFDVLRNTHYQYNISVKPNAPDLDFTIEYEVVPWESETIEIEFN